MQPPRSLAVDVDIARSAVTPRRARRACLPEGGNLLKMLQPLDVYDGCTSAHQYAFVSGDYFGLMPVLSIQDKFDVCCCCAVVVRE